MKLIDKIREEFGYDREVNYKVDSKNVVAYCRRSEKDSKIISQSTSVQEKTIKEAMKEKGLRVTKSFKVDGESSSRGSKRPSIDALMEYCRNPENKVAYVAVFHSERFGRDGAYLSTILDELIDLGIGFIDLDDEQDVFTNQGRLNQIMKFYKAEGDNEKRKKYISANIEDKLRQGYIMGKTPFGYDQGWVNDIQGGEQLITINDEGELLKLAFEMKLKEGVSNKEIVDKLKGMGLNIKENKLTFVFSNPMYCGLVRDKRHPAARCIGVGKHPAIVSMEDFCRINGLINPNRKKRKVTDREELPLRRHLKCASCDNNMTGEYKEKKNLGYYRCNHGCKCNINTITIHDLYEDLLNKYCVKEEFIPMLKEKLHTFFEYLNADNEARKREFQMRINDLNNSKEMTLNKLLEEMDVEIGAEYKDRIKRLKSAIESIEDSLAKLEFDMINIDSAVDSALCFASSLATLWCDGDFDLRQEVQHLAFPKGVLFDKKSNSIQPVEVNPILGIIGFLRDEVEMSGQNDGSGDGLVPHSENDKNRTVKINNENPSISTNIDVLDELVDDQHQLNGAGISPVVLTNIRLNYNIPYSEWLMWLSEIRYFMNK